MSANEGAHSAQPICLDCHLLLLPGRVDEFHPISKMLNAQSPNLLHRPEADKRPIARVSPVGVIDLELIENADQIRLQLLSRNYRRPKMQRGAHDRSDTVQKLEHLRL